MHKFKAPPPPGPTKSNNNFFVGNYIQMMNALRIIGFDVLECLSQLYDYYLYAVSSPMHAS